MNFLMSLSIVVAVSSASFGRTLQQPTPPVPLAPQQDGPVAGLEVGKVRRNLTVWRMLRAGLAPVALLSLLNVGLPVFASEPQKLRRPSGLAPKVLIAQLKPVEMLRPSAPPPPPPVTVEETYTPVRYGSRTLDRGAKEYLITFSPDYVYVARNFTTVPEGFHTGQAIGGKIRIIIAALPPSDLQIISGKYIGRKVKGWRVKGAYTRCSGECYLVWDNDMGQFLIEIPNPEQKVNGFSVMPLGQASEASTAK